MNICCCCLIVLCPNLMSISARTSLTAGMRQERIAFIKNRIARTDRIIKQEKINTFCVSSESQETCPWLDIPHPNGFVPWRCDHQFIMCYQKLQRKRKLFGKAKIKGDIKNRSKRVYATFKYCCKKQTVNECTANLITCMLMQSHIKNWCKIGFFNTVIPIQSFIQSRYPDGYSWHPVYTFNLESRLYSIVLC